MPKVRKPKGQKCRKNVKQEQAKCVSLGAKKVKKHAGLRVSPTMNLEAFELDEIFWFIFSLSRGIYLTIPRAAAVIDKRADI